MNTSRLSSSNPDFSSEAISKQLDSIFTDPHFSDAAILKRFLSYIVFETLNGRSNCLKEYTIALKVLDKPSDFKPQENGIVRIHAGRLRRALDHYYSQIGAEDELIISIPKGKYVPTFISRNQERLQAECDNIVDKAVDDADERTVVAVVPLLCNDANTSVSLFMNSFCLQLSDRLMDQTGVSVISYQAVKGLVEANHDLRDLSKALNCQFIISGCIQFLNKNVRANLQLFKAKTGEQIWHRQYERAINRTNQFLVQDEMVRCVANEVQRLIIVQPLGDHSISPLSAAV